jgi:hypothetical protein
MAYRQKMHIFTTQELNMHMMKKVLKVILISLLAVIVVALVAVHITYVSFSPGDRGVPVDEKNLVYFQDSYDACREAFLEDARKAAGAFEQAELCSVQVPSSVDDHLYVDFLYIPPTDSSDKLLVLSSAVHGVEGYTGSAVQQMFEQEMLGPELLSKMGILVIHSVNPYGFKYGRRVTEHNVDLNRNSDTDPALFQIKNPGYGALYDMLNPQGEASTASLRSQFFYMIAISKMMKESMSVLRQAVLQGQYEYPEGVYFGGTDFEPQIDSLQRILPAIFEPYRTILEIDLHTGYGARRVLHLFPNPVDDPELVRQTEAVFDGYHIDWGDTEDFYTITGGFADTFLKKIKPDATYLYMVFECGTFDTQKTFGSLKALQKIINENQGVHHGYKNSRQQEKIERELLEAYYPSSEAWRSEVLGSSRKVLGDALANFAAL